MKTQLESISIKGLHGTKDLNIRLRDNTLILVGENGSGKTTFLRILFHFLSGRWFLLSQYQFHSVSIRISGADHCIKHELLARAFQTPDKGLFAQIPPHLRARLKEIIASGNPNRLSTELEQIRSHFDIPMDVFLTQLDLFVDKPHGAQKELQSTSQKIRNAVQSQILYLPTYRRIERELGSIFEGFDSDDLRRGRNALRPREPGEAFIELVEFGMKDVQKAIERTLETLKEFARESLNNLTLRYLGDVVNEEYLAVGMKEIATVPEVTISSVLDRIHESILTTLHKQHILKVINVARTSNAPDAHSKIICHYFLKLLHFQEQLKEREGQISAFCDLCSEYIKDKQFVYDSATFGFNIVRKDSRGPDTKLELSDLSSGEKQIVSLFSHLYLSGKDSYFVLIDEPELSLSVPWQRRFLVDIRKGKFCDGLVAVTHSPFIYDNELHQYAHALGEFSGI